MRPVYEFISNFSVAVADEPCDDGPPVDSSDEEAGLGPFEADDTVRNVCFVWPNGRKVFFNYGYLITGAFEPNGDKNRIELRFSSQTVTLLGCQLDTLFTSFLSHLPRLVTAIEPRYVLEDEKARDCVVDIVITKSDV